MNKRDLSRLLSLTMESLDQLDRADAILSEMQEPGKLQSYVDDKAIDGIREELSKIRNSKSESLEILMKSL